MAGAGINGQIAADSRQRLDVQRGRRSLHLDPGERRGVLELAGALENEILYADWDNRLREKLKAGVDEAAQLKMRLEAALADWAPREANRLSELLEDALSELERNASTLLNI